MQIMPPTGLKNVKALSLTGKLYKISTMNRYLSHFAVITILPAYLLVIGASWGGLWPLIALLFLTLFGFALDQIFEASDDGQIETSLNTLLPIALAVIHFMLLGFAIWTLSQHSGAIWEKILIYAGFSLYFANTSNANGHELIHRRTRLEYNLGKWVFISHLFGHHTSAHMLIHHPYVSTPYDPNSAPYNRGFWQFWPKAWRGSFLAGLRAENARRGLASNRFPNNIKHPYVTYTAGALALLVLVGLFTGLPGVLWYLALAFSAQTGLLLTDYIQHYGLQRAEGADGKFEPVNPSHSWNSSHWFTRHLTLNAVRHSDHHAKPMKRYNELQRYPSDQAPELPYPAGIMSFIALFPRWWRRTMNPRLHQLAQQSVINLQDL